MKDFCFYSIYGLAYKNMGDGCLNSIKKFYPTSDVLFFEVPLVNNAFDLKTFCEYGIVKGKELLNEYKRIIYVDSDHIMCDQCPEMFEEFDMGVVRNNIPCGPSHGGEMSNVYINAGLQISTNKDAWEEFLGEFYSRYRSSNETLNTQNALNHLFHTSKFKYKLLEYPDKTYGISSMDGYAFLKVKDGSLYVKTENQDTREVEDKKVRMLHFAGNVWKKEGQIDYKLIENEEARNLLISYTL